MAETAWPYMVSKDEGGLLAPLFLSAVCGEEDSNVIRNIRNTLSMDYKLFTPLMDSCCGTVSVVGSAPSIANTYHDLVGDIIACNQAHDYLWGQGISPTYGTIWDAGEVMKTLIHPVNGTKYLIASRCHPDVITMFKDHETVIWHALGDEIISELLTEYNRMEPIIGGGSGAVTRMMFLAHVMGYRDIHLFGADSSCKETAHVVASPVDQNYIEIKCQGRWFKTTPQLCAQVEEFKILAPMLKSMGTVLTLHGDGLLPHVANELGFNVVP